LAVGTKLVNRRGVAVNISWGGGDEELNRFKESGGGILVKSRRDPEEAGSNACSDFS
jgi:hypothetical protein